MFRRSICWASFFLIGLLCVCWLLLIILLIKVSREIFEKFCVHLHFPKVRVFTFRGHSHSGHVCDLKDRLIGSWSGIAGIPWVGCVSSVFSFLFSNFKFLGTNEFLVSIWILNIQILPPLFAPCKISHRYLWLPRVKNHFVSMICHFLFALLNEIESEEHLETPWCNMLVKRWHIALCWEDKINLWNLPFCICFTIA